MRAHKTRLGIETDLWALINPDGSIRGGDYRPFIFWGKQIAKSQLKNKPFADCRLARVRVVEVSDPSKP